MNPIIDVHAHIFCAKDIPLKGYLLSRNYEEKLLKKNSTIELRLPIDLPKGKVKIDAIVTDLLGEAVKRKFITIKVKK